MSTRRQNLSLLKIKDFTTANAGLWLDKYIENQDKQPEDKKNDGSKTQLVKEVAALQEPAEYKEFFKRWEASLTEAGAITRFGKVKGRMAVGLGDEGVLETSVTLHRTYGVPYIPGSALKGLAASYARNRADNSAWKSDGEAYKVVFGDTENAGYITFFDALYVPGSGHKGLALYPDVITVHHPGYYQDAKKAPSDRDDPNPVPFLSATGSYLLALAAPELEQKEAWITATFELLRIALEEMGIGAKTSSGYGRIEMEKPYQRPNIQTFKPGDQVRGIVIDEKTDPIAAKYIKEGKASKALRHLPFPTDEVIVLLAPEYVNEASNMKTGNQTICQFVEEWHEDNRTILLCAPRPKKGK